VRPDDFVWNRSASHRDRHHVATRAIDGLANRFRNFVRLAGCESNATLAVSDGDESVERKAAPALHDFRDTIDRDHVLDELAAALTTTAFAIARLAITARPSPALTAFTTATALSTAAAWATASATATATTTASATTTAAGATATA
jgi:hypothetical protein